jgi:RNA polymerase sigma-70 factor (ECF subfamily)
VDSSYDTVTLLLEQLRAGDRGAESQLLQLVYPELRRIAGHYLRRERPGHTLQATALVNEVYVRVTGQTREIQNRAHFLAVAAQAMRRILVDHARGHRAAKRGGLHEKVSLDHVDAASPIPDLKLLALDEALLRLSDWDARQAKVVELRFFGGMTEDEIGEVLGTSARTVKRDWKLARAWLYDQIGK